MAGGEWGEPRYARSLSRALRIPLLRGSTVDVEIWEGRPLLEGLLFQQRLVVPEWDIYLIFLRSRGSEAQRWLGAYHQIEAGWVSEYEPTARVLNRAQPSQSAE